jgi:DNA-dependent RNA polymerase auxiliary subunit epsilon
MAEPTPYNVSEAVKPNGFVDFYLMLGLEPGAPLEDVRARINALYSEAQANRDHRNLNKRREYQTLLEYLPHARTALLDADKRTQYNEYSAQVQSGAATDNFTTFMGKLSGAAAAQEDRTDVLGVQDAAARSARGTGTAAPAPSPRRKAGASRAKQGLIGSAISVVVFFVLLAIVFAVTKRLEFGVLAGAIAGAITWVVTHRGKGGISV